MQMESPFILSLAYKSQLIEVCKRLSDIDLQYFVMYIIFNNGSKFILSNIFQHLIPYYQEGFYKEDFSFKSEIIEGRQYYCCDEINSISHQFKIALEERFGVHRAYYIIRRCAECSFIFGAIKNKKFTKCEDIYKKTIKEFEKFCISFVNYFLTLIVEYNPQYKTSFILNNPKLLNAVITQNNMAPENLTERECECLWWAAKGKSAKEVGKILNISPFTVESHYKKIKEKFNCSTLIEAVVEGIQRGFIGAVDFSQYLGKKNSPNSNLKVIKNMYIAKQEIGKTNLALLNKLNLEDSAKAL